MPSSSSIKPKAAPKDKTSPPPNGRDKDKDSKMHRRSRAGCYTCRLRRKKCDEKRNVCTACSNLKIECHYVRPSWWANAEKRAMKKNELKESIRETRTNEKPAAANAAGVHSNLNSPPSLCHSMPNSDVYSDFGARAPSIDSHFSPQFDLETPKDFVTSTPFLGHPHWTPIPGHFPQFTPSIPQLPYEIDVKTESSMFLNDEPIRKDSSYSTFNHFQESPEFNSPQFENWVKHEQSEWYTEVLEEPVEFDVFEFPHTPGSPTHETNIEVAPEDKYLLEHFLNTVAPMIFPILDINQQATAQRGAILPALETNKSYLHCCLSIAALHLRASGEYAAEQEAHINSSIMSHRWLAIGELCQAINNDDVNRSHVLETMLAMIVFESSVAPPSEDLENVPWHQHLAGAKDIIERLGLMDSATEAPAGQLPFNATLATWVDILGATMEGKLPLFHESYRHKIEGGITSGLAELMGCDDRVMYLIAEISSLERLKNDGRLDNLQLCSQIANLGELLSQTEMGPGEVADVFSPTGAIKPKQLIRNITALFRIAARIHLCSLVPGFDQRQPNILSLVDSFSSIMNLIPVGPHGHDRSLVWPLLVAGSVSGPDSPFRAMFAERTSQLGHAATIGSFGRLTELLHDIWKQNDQIMGDAEAQTVHWRTVMQQKAWDVLLI